MELNTATVISILVALMLVIPGLSSLPLEMEGSPDEDQHIAAKRPKYMDTRDLESLEQSFRDLVLVSLEKLADDGLIDNILVKKENDENTAVEKRRRHITMCLRRSGRHFVHFPCYKPGRR